MNKSQAIDLLKGEGWTEADAKRALEVIDFKTNPDEITIRRAISLFAGSELYKRQRLQAAQKGMVTKKNNEIERIHQEYAGKIEQVKRLQKQESEKQQVETPNLADSNKVLEMQLKRINAQNKELIKANEELKKDNKALKNLIDEIRLKLAINTKKLLQYEDSEIRKALIIMFKSTLG